MLSKVSIEVEENMEYLLAVLINVTNFEPVITKDCVKIDAGSSKIELEKSKRQFVEAGLACEKKPDTLVYDCQNLKSNTIGKIVIMNDLNECKSFAKSLANNLKKLMEKK